MKKQVLLLCAAFLLARSLSAQDAKPVVIVSTTGKVALIPQGQTTTLGLQSSAVAKNTGQLKLSSKKASAVVYCNGQFKEVSGKKTVALASICGEDSGKRTVNADYDFGNYVVAAVQMVAVAKTRGDGWAASVGDKTKEGDGWGNSVGDKTKEGDGWGNSVGDKTKEGDGWGNSVGDKTKEGDGWGGKGSSIMLILPFGKVSASPITFSWSKPATSEPYKFEIQDKAGNTVHSVTVRDTFARVDLRSLNLSAEKIYRWKVSVAGSKPLESNEREFAVGSDKELAEVLGMAKNSPLANSTKSPALSGLIEAIALENNQWHYAAQQVYAGLQKKNPDNLVNMMYAAFWMRNGYRRLAEKAARG